MNVKDLKQAIREELCELGADAPSTAIIGLVLAAMGVVIMKRLAAGDADVEQAAPLPGLGKLVAVTQAARTGRNPATGETLEIPERRVVKFRPSAALKSAVGGAK